MELWTHRVGDWCVLSSVMLGSAYLHLPCMITSVSRSSTGCKTSDTGDLQFGFGNYEAWFCYLAKNFFTWSRILVCPYVIFGVGQPNQGSSWATPDYLRVASELAVTSSDMASVYTIRVSAKSICDLCESLEDVTCGAKPEFDCNIALECHPGRIQPHSCFPFFFF